MGARTNDTEPVADARLSRRRRGTAGRILPVTLVLLASCGPSEKQTEDSRIYCLDHVCKGDILPKYDTRTEQIFKFNGQWFVGPREYFSRGFNGASFQWWEHKPLSSSAELPKKLREVRREGKSNESIFILIRSYNIPRAPHGYSLIQLAEQNDWIASRTKLRPGLEAIEMKHVIGPDGYYIDHMTYYVATELTGFDGLPPVALCNHDDPRNGGGTGFMWKSDIWAGAQMNQKHCADWPEIYPEIVRVLQLLRRAQP